MEEEKIDDPITPRPCASETQINSPTSTKPSIITQLSQVVIRK